MDIISQRTTVLDDLYTRYSCRLLAAVTERLVAVGPTAIVLDEDVTQDVWTYLAEHGLPWARTSLEALLEIADRMVGRVRRDQARQQEFPAGLTRTIPTSPTDRTSNGRAAIVLPARVSDAVTALAALPLAG
ncbi:hypothetical protein OHV05_37615 (plasmid) [Kitasatospora sp. NBC_00070]|uniref:hypothetical protein n=1 Tax=Kitasatospora sp. NBC_00070 TaxID=2975962 RepID=UPI002F91AB20